MRDSRGRFVKGNVNSKASLKKQSLAVSGRKKSAEHREKISKSLSGKKYPNRSGKNNHFWKGGITPITRAIRTSLTYRQWRTAIFQRDDYTCQKCDKSGGKLNVDHYPKTFSEIIAQYNIASLEEAVECEALWDIENNRTLCEPCHKLTKTFGSRPKNLGNVVGGDNAV